MDIYRFILIAISIFYINISQAQTSDQKNKIGIHVGYNVGAYKNLVLSPVVLYEYNSPVFEFDYRRKTKKDRLFILRVKHWNTTLKSDKIPKLNLDYSNSSLRIDYLFPVVQKANFVVHTGFFSQTTEAIQKSDKTLIAGEIRQKIAWSGRFSYKLNDKHTISTQLSLPFFWFVYGNLDQDIYSFKRYQSYNFDLSYNYKLSNNFEATLRSFSNYDRIQSNNVFRELQNQITLGINYNF